MDVTFGAPRLPPSPAPRLVTARYRIHLSCPLFGTVMCKHCDLGGLASGPVVPSVFGSGGMSMVLETITSMRFASLRPLRLRFEGRPSSSPVCFTMFNPYPDPRWVGLPGHLQTNRFFQTSPKFSCEASPLTSPSTSP